MWGALKLARQAALLSSACSAGKQQASPDTSVSLRAVCGRLWQGNKVSANMPFSMWRHP